MYIYIYMYTCTHALSMYVWIGDGGWMDVSKTMYLCLSDPVCPVCPVCMYACMHT